MTSGPCCGGDAQASSQTTHEPSSHAVEILEERFARGEIDNAEFEEKRQILFGSRKDTASGSGSQCC